MNVEVSIIVPVYNVEKYIEKCIKSILSQTYQEFELILVNDGTKDHSLEICRNYKSDCRVRIISQPNKGLSAARNTGIHVARGKYLLFVDGDDYIDPEMLEELYNQMILEDADIVQCGFIWVMENKELKVEKFKGCISKRVVCGDEWFEVYKRNGLLFACPWNKLYKKTLFDKIKYPNGKLNEDEYVLFPLFCTAQKVVILNQELYYYVKRKSGIMGTMQFEQIIENYLIYALKRLAILWQRNKALFGRYLYMYYRDLIYYEILIKENQLNHKLIYEMKKQALRFIGVFFRYSDVDLKTKMAILKWNIKLI